MMRILWREIPAIAWIGIAIWQICQGAPFATVAICIACSLLCEILLTVQRIERGRS